MTKGLDHNSCVTLFTQHETFMLHLNEEIPTRECWKSNTRTIAQHGYDRCMFNRCFESSNDTQLSTGTAPLIPVLVRHPRITFSIRGLSQDQMEEQSRAPQLF